MSDGKVGIGGNGWKGGSVGEFTWRGYEAEEVRRRINKDDWFRNMRGVDGEGGGSVGLCIRRKRK
jgi:hypothetical protein